MNIRFGRVYAKNFLSFREAEFDFSAFGSRTMLISGVNRDIENADGQSNGSGKSTIFQTLLFAIYGDTLGNGKSAHVRNWNCGPRDQVVVTLEVETDGKKYVITRSLSGKKALSELRVAVRNDDGSEEDVTRSTIAETQKMIETDVVPCGKEGFLRCIVLTADQNYNFFKMNKAAKNEFFESLFDLASFTEAYGRLHRKTIDDGNSLVAESRTMDQLKDSIAKLERDREDAMKSKSGVAEAEKALEDAKRALSGFDASSDVEGSVMSAVAEADAIACEKSSERKAALAKYDADNGIVVYTDGSVGFSDAVERSVDECMAEFDKRHGISSVDDDGRILFDGDAEKARITMDGKSLSSRIENGESLVAKMEAEDGSFRKMHEDAESEIRSNEYAISDRKRRISSHSGITGILCEDCAAKYRKAVSIDALDEEIDGLAKKNAELRAKSDDFLAKSTKNSKSIVKYRAAIESMKARRDELRSELSSLVSRQRLLQKERDLKRSSLSSELDERKRKAVRGRDEMLKSYDAEISSIYDGAKRKAEKIRSEHDAERNRLSDCVKNAEYRLKVVSETSAKSFDAPISSLEEGLKASRERFLELDRTVAHEKALESVLKPESIRKSVVADMLRELNFRICGYLAKMGSNYSCRFDEDFEATFTSSKGVETEYGFFSAGERMRLSIACCFAFKDFMQVRLNIRPNILAIDEYIDSNLDANAVNGIMELIRYMVATEGMTAFIISHRSEIKNGMFDGEIVVTKKDDASTIEVAG